MMNITKEFAKKHSWDEELESFDEYVRRANKAFELGWNPDEEEDLDLFEYDVDEAIELGWDKNEMSYQEFKTLLQQLNELYLDETKEGVILTKEIMKRLYKFGYDPSKDDLSYFANNIAEAVLRGWNGVQPLEEFDDIYLANYYTSAKEDPAEELYHRQYVLDDFDPNPLIYDLKEPVEEIIKPVPKVVVAPAKPVTVNKPTPQPVKKKSKAKYAFIIPSTVIYSLFWFTMHFIIVGFFMPTPVRFYRKLNGTSVKSRPKKSALDDLTIDRIAMYDMLDDDDE